MPGGGTGAVTPPGGANLHVFRRRDSLCKFRGRNFSTCSNDIGSSRETGFCCESCKECPHTCSVGCLPGNGIEFQGDAHPPVSGAYNEFTNDNQDVSTRKAGNISAVSKITGHDGRRSSSPAHGLATHEAFSNVVCHTQATPVQGQAPSGAGYPTMHESTVHLEKGRVSPQGCPIGEHASPCDCNNGCIHHRVGRDMQRRGSEWTLVPNAIKSSYKCVGALHSDVSTPPFSPNVEGTTCACQVGQHICNCIHQPSGRDTVSSPFSGREPLTLMVREEQHPLSSGCACAGACQCGRGLAVTGQSTCGGLAPTSTGGGGDLVPLWQGRYRPIRIATEHAVPPVVLLGGRQPPLRSGRAGTSLAQSPPVCIPTNSSSPSDSSQSEGGAHVTHSGSPNVAQPALVCRPLQFGSRLALGDSTTTGPADTRPRYNLAPTASAVETGGLAAERVRLSGAGLSDAVVETIQSSRALSTRTLYTLKWRVFDQWCSARGHDPFQCPVTVILNFLQELLEQGKAASTIKVYVAAISACHFGIGGASPGSHPLVVRFMAGVRRIRVPHPVLFPAWDLLVVLRALAEPPFEPLQSVDIKTLSLKTALLVALASAKRVSEIHALSVHPSCLRFSAGGERVVLCPNASFTPKVVTAPFQNQRIELSSFSPPPFASVEEEKLNKLCPVRALRFYLDSTKGFRRCEQLFVCYGAASRGKALSKDRLAHWIVEAIEMAYKSLDLEPPVGLRAHSTRGVSSSWARHRGVSVSEICRAAGWSSVHTFVRFYMLNVTESPVSQAVLGAGSTETLSSDVRTST